MSFHKVSIEPEKKQREKNKRNKKHYRRIEGKTNDSIMDMKEIESGNRKPKKGRERPKEIVKKMGAIYRIRVAKKNYERRREYTHIHTMRE